MKRDPRLRITLHILAHLAEGGTRPTTSEELAAHFSTNPVVIRRALAGLREAGIAASAKGHGGGWNLARPAAAISLREVYAVLGTRVGLEPDTEPDAPSCLIEQAVEEALGATYAEAETLLLRRLEQISLADITADYRRRRAAHTAASPHADTPDG
jgi:Rrf2 family protein